MIDDGEEDLQRFDTPEEALQYIRYAGSLSDDDFNLSEAALALALLFLPGINVSRYRHHLEKLCRQVSEEYESRLRMGSEDILALRVKSLRKILHEAHDYIGDEENYDDLQNANIIRVIERRKGMPIALGILYIILARAQGWKIDGLNFPGHFLVRLEMDGVRIILDPFQLGREMNAVELRQLLKSTLNKSAELAHDYYEPVNDRAILVRLENNLKTRLIETDEYAQALVVVEAMEALAPDEPRLLFDKGILYVKLGQIPQALLALENYVEKTPDAREKQQVSLLIAQIRNEMQ